MSNQPAIAPKFRVISGFKGASESEFLGLSAKFANIYFKIFSKRPELGQRTAGILPPETPKAQ
jgi:hypothetical protein